MKLHPIGAFASAIVASSRLLGVASASESGGGGGCFDETSPFHPDDWTYCQVITDTLRMYYAPLDDTVMVGLHATEGVYGWSALAPSGNGGMKGAAQTVVRKNESGEWIAEDRHSFDKVTPSLDEKQDVQLLFAQQDDDTGETAWGVVIPQDSCDDPYDYAIEDKSILLLYAFGGSHGFTFHGGNRGTFTGNLMGPPPEIPDMDDYDHVDLVMPNVHMVRGEEGKDPTNAYICTYFDMDELGKEKGFTSEDKVHNVGFAPIFDEGNEEYIHHTVVFGCNGNASSGGGTSGLDDSNLEHELFLPACENMPPGCNNLFVVWATGQDPQIYPEEVGLTIGEGQRWLVMQMHYYNPRLVEDVYDSSGMRLYITKDLRPIDGGLMTFNSATIEGQHAHLPGGRRDVSTGTLYVEPDCTNGWSEPLNIIGVFHHSHFMGLNQEIVVERDGKNLGPIRKEHLYDYNHQGIAQPVTALQQLLPGDRLAATCHFDTSSVSSDSDVKIGEQTDWEMCFQTILYYPKQSSAYGFMRWDADAVQVYFNHEYCTSPPSDGSGFGSLCAEKVYTEFSNVMNLGMLGAVGVPYDGASYTYPSFCNGGNATAEMRNALEGMCPEGCTETQSCGEEWLMPYSEAVCQSNCKLMGVSVYPDTSRSTPYDSVTFGCGEEFYFDAPILAEPEVCKVKGSLPQTIELTEVTDKSAPSTGADEPPSNTEPDNSGAEANGHCKLILVAFLFGLSFLL